MKKFIITIAAYFLILGTLVCGINGLYILKDDTDPLDVERFEAMPDTLHICNLGSSHGRLAFNYSETPDVGAFNFALSAQTLSYDYRMLSHYQDRLAEGCVVFIPVSYFSFFGHDETELADFESKNERYYHLLPRELIKEYDLITYLCTVPFPAVGAGTNAIKVFLPKEPASNTGTTIRTADMIDIAENGHSAYWKHLVHNRQDADGNLIFQETELEALYDIIALCKSIGAVPILVTTPYLAEYTDQVLKNMPEFLPYFYSIIDQVSKDTDTPYYDYAFDDRFQHDYSLFRDADHLNKTGALLFTSILLEEVQSK